jgi:catechol 2,3-dioxygenase-like lactoylglutathione lyase family enzyme
VGADRPGSPAEAPISFRRQNDRVPLRVVALDHVQLAMPVGREAEAEAFYCDVLGFAVLPKPEPLASRGGRWFASGSVQVHLGVESDFRPARKAHPALIVDDFDDLIGRLDALGASWRWDEDQPGTRRLYVDDPFGNRVELIDSGR